MFRVRAVRPQMPNIGRLRNKL